MMRIVLKCDRDNLLITLQLMADEAMEAGQVETRLCVFSEELHQKVCSVLVVCCLQPSTIIVVREQER